jgi:hypothetical protein
MDTSALLVTTMCGEQIPIVVFGDSFFALWIKIAVFGEP